MILFHYDLIGEEARFFYPFPLFFVDGFGKFRIWVYCLGFWPKLKSDVQTNVKQTTKRSPQTAYCIHEYDQAISGWGRDVSYIPRPIFLKTSNPTLKCLIQTEGCQTQDAAGDRS
jgi:hypothetical protein